MSAAARGFTGNPFAVAAAGGDPPVERGRDLEGDQGPTLNDSLEKSAIEIFRVFGADSGRNRDARSLETFDALARDPRIGIDESNDDARDAGGNQSVGAGRGLAMMGARFQTDIGGGAPCRRAGPRQGFAFRVRPTAWLGPAAADDLVASHQDTAHRRIGPNRPKPALGERQGTSHPMVVGAGTLTHRGYRPSFR